VATDPSAAQIANAEPHPRITYRVSPAEDGPGASGFDLVTAAQALHWFDLPRFFTAVRKAARPGALVVAFSYGPLRTDSSRVDAVLSEFNQDLHARKFWPPERRLVEEGYASLAFPFAPVTVPPFTMEASRDARWLLEYVDTWSAIPRLKAAWAGALLEGFRKGILRAWGDPAQERAISWPLAVRAGTV
jgi:hypothetical protein